MFRVHCGKSTSHTVDTRKSCKTFAYWNARENRPESLNNDNFFKDSIVHDCATVSPLGSSGAVLSQGSC